MRHVADGSFSTDPVSLAGREQRTPLLQMAQVWQRLADDYADAVASLFPIPATERPVAQQQQQIQPKDDDKKE
jgi:hypothetical protein